MLITMFFVLLVGFGLYWKFLRDNTGIPLVLGVAGLSLCLCGVGLVYMQGQDNLIHYEQDKAKIGAAVSNINLTGEERLSAIDLAISDNAVILRNRRWYRNPIIGWFNSSAIAQLPLFDITRIPAASPIIRVEK